MNRIIPLTPSFAVTAALQAEDFAKVAALGFKGIISNLPDGELPHVPTSAQAAELAAAAGLAYWHLPATKFDVLSDRVLDGVVGATQATDGPLLAHCASGMRSALAWAGAAARFQSADSVLATLDAAGFKMQAMRDELQQVRDPALGPPPLPLTVDA